MAPYAENFSNRYRIKYTTGRFEHFLTVRYGVTPGAPGAPLIAVMNNVLSALEAHMTNDWNVIDAEYCPAGFTTFVPATAPAAVTPSWGSDIVRAREANFISFQGTSLDGRRTSFRIYGLNYFPELVDEFGDFRISGAEDVAIETVVNTMNATSGILSVIDGSQAIWRNYVNLKQDDDMVDVLRHS